MKLPIRISTSPPSLGHQPDEGSFYCDLEEIRDWRGYDIVRGLPVEIEALLARDATVAYLVRMSSDAEVGLLFCHADEESGLFYCAVDHLGGIEREPAANEALWICANVAEAVPAGHRLARTDT